MMMMTQAVALTRPMDGENDERRGTPRRVVPVAYGSNAISRANKAPQGRRHCGSFAAIGLKRADEHSKPPYPSRSIEATHTTAIRFLKGALDA
uniref:Uncharacterized protein n=1 Tax=Plectus sambesii TaxID=2011161 RepID=A0A914UMJ0_9BILA